MRIESVFPQSEPLHPEQCYIALRALTFLVLIIPNCRCRIRIQVFAQPSRLSYIKVSKVNMIRYQIYIFTLLDTVERGIEKYLKFKCGH